MERMLYEAREIVEIGRVDIRACAVLESEVWDEGLIGGHDPMWLRRVVGMSL